MTVEVTVNGRARHVPPGTTVRQVVATVTAQDAGVAAAVNGNVVPRHDWTGTPLRHGDRVEVVTAAQGG